MSDYRTFIAMLQMADIKYSHYNDGSYYNVTVSETTFVFSVETGKLLCVNEV